MGEGIRVNTIQPGIFNTPLLQGAPDNLKAALTDSVPFPKRLGDPDEYAHIVETMVTNGYFNGESVWLDGVTGWRHAKGDDRSFSTLSSWSPSSRQRPVCCGGSR